MLDHDFKEWQPITTTTTQTKQDSNQNFNQIKSLPDPILKQAKKWDELGLRSKWSNIHSKDFVWAGEARSAFFDNYGT